MHAGWRDVVLLVALAPLAYYVTAIIAAVRFFRRERGRPLSSFTPPVSLLKPVRGVDFGSWENFSSFCQQDYPEYEILFAVKDETDPAVPMIQRLAARVSGTSNSPAFRAEQIGANHKVNNLTTLMAREAHHDILVLTDGDVRVRPNYLREVIAPFADAKSRRSYLVLSRHRRAKPRRGTRGHRGIERFLCGRAGRGVERRNDFRAGRIDR